MTKFGRQVEMSVEQDFEAFYRHHEPRIRRALVALAGPAVGADAAATAMSYAFEHWDRVAAMDNPAGYLYQVGRNASRRRRLVPRLVPPVAPDAEYPYEPGLPAAISRLTPPQRSAVLLVHAWGYPLTEAADVLGVSVSTLRNHLERGLARLRHTLGATDV